MADGIGFDISALDEYAESMLDYATKEFPKVTERFMKSEATKLKNKAKRKAKSSLKSQPTGNYVKGFKAGKKVYEYAGTQYNVRVYNGSPHAHLIEHGHNMVTHDGKLVGFVPGKHILENSALAYQPNFQKNIESKLVEKVEEALDK